MEKKTRRRGACSLFEQRLLVGIMTNVERLREERRLTNIGFAEAAGISRESMWRRGNEEYFPSIAHMTMLSRTLRVHMTELFLSSEDMKRLLLSFGGRRDMRFPPVGESAEIPELDYSQTLSFNLLKYRRRNGLTLKTLERKMKGISAFTSLGRYESGTMPFPTRLVVPASVALDTNPLVLLTPEDRLREVVGILARKYLVSEEMNTVSA